MTAAISTSIVARFATSAAKIDTTTAMTVTTAAKNGAMTGMTTGTITATTTTVGADATAKRSLPA